jgi:hypothetical protein
LSQWRAWSQRNMDCVSPVSEAIGEIREMALAATKRLS